MTWARVGEPSSIAAALGSSLRIVVGRDAKTGIARRGPDSFVGGRVAEPTFELFGRARPIACHFAEAMFEVVTARGPLGGRSGSSGCPDGWCAGRRRVGTRRSRRRSWIEGLLSFGSPSLKLGSDVRRNVGCRAEKLFAAVFDRLSQAALVELFLEALTRALGGTKHLGEAPLKRLFGLVGRSLGIAHDRLDMRPRPTRCKGSRDGRSGGPAARRFQAAELERLDERGAGTDPTMLSVVRLRPPCFEA